MICATQSHCCQRNLWTKIRIADVVLPQGAAEVAGIEDLTNEVRTQIGKGADLIKIYADYRWGKDSTVKPTFSTEAIAWAISIAKSGGREVVTHAATPEGMKRAIMGGVSTIEHGDMGTEEVFKLMKEKGVALCPTLLQAKQLSNIKDGEKASIPIHNEL